MLLAADLPAPVKEMFENRCTDCHDEDTKKGGLDLTALSFDLSDRKTFSTWVKIHDRVQKHEMPPRKEEQPEKAEVEGFLKAIAEPLVKADAEVIAANGRSTWRRMNRFEYENTLRDLLGAPWLEVKEMLPEDGEMHRFNKVGDALDVSHVQISRYLGAADYALKEVMARKVTSVQPTVKRYYAREQARLWKRSRFSEFNRSVERAAFLIVNDEADIPALTDDDAVIAGLKNNDPERRENESVGVVASSYEPMEPAFNNFTAPVSGRYKLRVKAKSFWAGPDDEKKWWKPVQTNVSKGRTEEPVSFYAERPPRQLRKLDTLSFNIEPSVGEMEVYLVRRETIRPDAVRLFRSRPPAYKNPLAEKDGQPGVTFYWLEVEGPLPEPSVDAAVKVLFGDLPLKKEGKLGTPVAVSKDPMKDAEKLIPQFMARAYRRSVSEEEPQRFLALFKTAMDAGASFTESMLTTYSAVLCSPAFVTLEEKPGKLDDLAVASRISYFLKNSEPDAVLRKAAKEGKLQDPDTLISQTDRIIGQPESNRFINAFLDYWLDLRKVNDTSPDETLYPDYYLDDYLVESSVDETRAFFTELVRNDLPASNLVHSDFVMVNQRLAQHYGLTEAYDKARGSAGVSELVKVKLPEDSPRGGLMTQASVLKVTANGTTTSPVIRGVWIMERLLGDPVPPPPSAVPAVEPDTRGATTIREQLEKHRSQESCNACHVKIDPTGFALESFDVLGGWREHYRALGEGGEKTPGIGKNGQTFVFHDGPAVDASGNLPDGRAFQNIRELKKLLLSDERAIARNLISQLTVYATGSPVRFSDREKIERILDASAASGYGVRTLIRNLVTSDLFLYK